MGGKIITKEDIIKERAVGFNRQQEDFIRDMVRNEIGRYAGILSEQIRFESALLRVDLYKETEKWDKLMLSCLMVCHNRMATPAVCVNAIEQMHEIKDKLSEKFVDENQEFCKVCIEWLNEIKTKPLINKVKCNEIINVLYKEVKDENN